MADISIQVTHPRTSDRFLADVDPACTVGLILEQLQLPQNGSTQPWMDPAVPGRPYVLIMQRTNAQLPTSATMAEIGARDGEAFVVQQNSQAAEPELTPTERGKRLTFDYTIVEAMNDDVMDARAYRSSNDLQEDRNPIIDVKDASKAVIYRVLFSIPTLVGEGAFVPETEFLVDLRSRRYPYEEPVCWVISALPFSPHFTGTRPACIGEWWEEGKGQYTLGHLLIHLAKMLNWDEVYRENYDGYNKAALDYHRRVYKGRPLTPGQRYPHLPTSVIHGQDLPPPKRPAFRPKPMPSAGRQSLFRPT